MFPTTTAIVFSVLLVAMIWFVVISKLNTHHITLVLIWLTVADYATTLYGLSINPLNYEANSYNTFTSTPMLFAVIKAIGLLSIVIGFLLMTQLNKTLGQLAASMSVITLAIVVINNLIIINT